MYNRRTIYWYWRLSIWSRPWFALKTWLFLIWRAREIALHLERYVNAVGSLKAGDQYFLMRKEVKHELGKKYVLPPWKWHE